jgi:hypothetical protein
MFSLCFPSVAVLRENPVHAATQAGCKTQGETGLFLLFCFNGAKSVELLELLDEVLVVRVFSFAVAALLRPCVG